MVLKKEDLVDYIAMAAIISIICMAVTVASIADNIEIFSRCVSALWYIVPKGAARLSIAIIMISFSVVLLVVMVRVAVAVILYKSKPEHVPDGVKEDGRVELVNHIHIIRHDISQGINVERVTVRDTPKIPAAPC